MSMSSQTLAPPADVDDLTRGLSWRRQVCRLQRVGLSITAALPVKRARAAIAGATALETRFDVERQRHQSLRLPHSHRTMLIR